MGIADLSVFRALKAKMEWSQVRQRVLSENVANADTPGYVAHDLKALKFSDTLHDRGVAPVRMEATQQGHLRTSSEASFIKNHKIGGFETTPDGNNVALEEQMMKVTANQMDYEAATTLYMRGLGMLKTAIGKR